MHSISNYGIKLLSVGTVVTLAVGSQMTGWLLHVAMLLSRGAGGIYSSSGTIILPWAIFKGTNIPLLCSSFVTRLRPAISI